MKAKKALSGEQKKAYHFAEVNAEVAKLDQMVSFTSGAHKSKSFC